MGKLVVLLLAAIGGALAKFWNALRGRFTPRKPQGERSTGGDIGSGGGADPSSGRGQGGGGFLE